jgi:hypothetical protein
VLEVTVVAGEGTPKDWGAIAYVLPAGAHGVAAIESVPHDDVAPGRPARIPVLVPGTYDVIVRSTHAALVQRDVHVGRDDASATFVLPPMAPIRFRVAGEMPPLAPHQQYLASVALESNLEKGLPWPGRSDSLRVQTATVLALDGTDDASPPVPTTATYAIRPSIMVEEDVEPTDPSGSHETAEWEMRDVELVPSAATAHGGDEVVLTTRASGRVVLTIRGDPSSWAPFPVTVRLGAQRRGDDRWEVEPVPLDSLEAARRWVRTGTTLALPVGTWSIEWGNDAIEPGKIEDVEVRSGATTERTIAVRARRPAADATSRLELDLSDVAWKGGAGLLVWKSGRRESFSAAHASLPVRDPSGDEAFVALGRDYASRPARPASEGRWRPRLEPAGAIVVVLDRVPERSFGRVTVRRADGFPVGIERSVGADDFEPEVEVAPGTILGPFPPGTVRLEVLVGGQRLREVEATVRAGGIESLRVPLPRLAVAR